MSEYKMWVTPAEFAELKRAALRFAMSCGCAGWVDRVRQIVGDERTDAALAAGRAMVCLDYDLKSPTSRAQMPQDGPEGPSVRHPAAGSGLDAWERA